MQRKWYVSVLLMSVLLWGCGSESITEPSASTEYEGLEGNDIINVVRRQDGNLATFRVSTSSSLDMVTTTDQGDLVSVHTIDVKPGSSLNKIVSLNDGASFLYMSGFGYAVLDGDGLITASAAWWDILDLSHWQPNSTNVVTFLGSNDQGFCVKRRVNVEHYDAHCLDFNGNLVWQLMPSQSVERIDGDLGQDGIVYLRTVEGEQSWLRAYTLSGSVLWELLTDDLPGENYNSNSLQWVNEKLLLIKYVKDEEDVTTQYFIHLNLDGSFHSVAEVATDNQLFYIQPYDANSYVALVRVPAYGMRLFRVNLNGEVLWVRNLPGRQLFIAFEGQQHPLRIDAQGNIVVIGSEQVMTPSLLVYPLKVALRYYFTRFNGNGSKIDEHLVGRYRYRIVSDVNPTVAVETGFAPNEFIVFDGGYVTAGIDTFYIAESNPDQTYTPPLTINYYSW